ncbi:MAG: hypothetical protein PVJ57_04465 [Phycisphaerae bacterium]
MKLPPIDNPERLRGLYVYDFGEWAAVGYTAEEIAVLLESEAYRGGHVYEIHRASPDGGLELRGVAPERFQAESGMFFYRRDLPTARADFAALRTAAERTPPPCRAVVQLADRRPASETAAFVIALIYPAEYESAMGRWLLAVDYAGGELVEGGPSHVSDYYAEPKQVVEREQLWGSGTVTSRTPEQVLASVRVAVQR